MNPKLLLFNCAQYLLTALICALDIIELHILYVTVWCFQKQVILVDR